MLLSDEDFLAGSSLTELLKVYRRDSSWPFTAADKEGRRTEDSPLAAQLLSVILEIFDFERLLP